MKYATFMQNHLELCKFVTYISFYLNIKNMQNKKNNNQSLRITRNVDISEYYSTVEKM